jgi:hypothetical protein
MVIGSSGVEWVNLANKRCGQVTDTKPGECGDKEVCAKKCTDTD